MNRIFPVVLAAGLLLTSAFLGGTVRAQTQDRIYTTDGQILVGEVLVVQAKQTRYIPIGSEVFLNLDNQRINKIEFANGTVQYFQDGTPQTPVEPELAPLPGIGSGAPGQGLPGPGDGDRMKQLYDKLKKKNINEMTQREYEFFKLMQAEELRESTSAPGTGIFTPYRRKLIRGFAYSAILPGSGHFYLGEPARGLGFLMGSIPAAAAMFAQNDQVRLAGLGGLIFLKAIDLLTIPGEINR